MFKKAKKAVKALTNKKRITVASQMAYYAYCSKHKPVNNQIILIESFHGQNISDSGLEFAKALQDTSYILYYATEDMKRDRAYIASIGLDVTPVDIFSREYVKVLATAGTIITNASLPIYFVKRKDQKYLQTWHGTPLKTLGKKLRYGVDTMYLAQHSFLQADYLTQPNDFTRDIIMQDYNLEELYTGKVVMAGYPRNRVFQLPGEDIKWRKKLKWDDKTVYVYMPTWRGKSAQTKDIDEYASKVKEIFTELDEYLTDNDLFFVKFHPLLRGAVTLDDYKHIYGFPTDEETYPVINACDVLITDYSSVFFDFSLTKKPIILFTYDYDGYMADRGMNMDIKDLPFRRVETTKELGECIHTHSYLEDDYTDTEYYKTFFSYDRPDMTDRLLDLVLNGNEEGFVIYDYSKNKEKNYHLIKPKVVEDAYDLNTIKEMSDDKDIVWFDTSYFKKNNLSVTLHDYFNDSFNYVFTRNRIAMTPGEFILSKMKYPKTKKVLKKRNLERTLPELKIDPKITEELSAFEENCVVGKSSIQPLFMTSFKIEGSKVHLSFNPKETCTHKVILNERMVILEKQPITNYTITYDLTHMIEEMKTYHHMSIRLGVIGETDGIKTLYVFNGPLDGTDIINTYGKAKLVEFNLPEDYFTVNHYRISLHRKEVFNNIVTTKLLLIPCINKSYKKNKSYLNGYLEIRIEDPDRKDLLPLPEVTVTSLKVKDERFILKAKTDIDKTLISGAKLIYRSKLEKYEYPVSLTITKGTKLTLDLAKDLALKEGFWDLYLLIEIENMTSYIKLKGKNAVIDNALVSNIECRKENHIFYPYYTRRRELSFVYRERSPYDKVSTHIKEWVAFGTYLVFGKLIRKKQPILIYEKFSRSAQDNSYYFFKYCMTLPEEEKKHIYYVIDKTSPDYKNVEKYDKHIIPFMSFKHMMYAMGMKYAVSTDAITHLYLWRSKPNPVLWMINKKKNILFLQHGVLALKRVEDIYGKQGTHPMKDFVVSSEKEKKIVVDYFGYDEDHVLVSGLARWDVLEDRSQENKPYILVMPTWRSWLEDTSEETFINSEYYKRYRNLLEDERLHKLLEEKEARLVLYLHPKFAGYTKQFKNTNDRISYVSFGEQPLNELMMHAKMLVTDYSSVCWDMLYMDKPVIFYQFDLGRYMITNGSYIDMNTDLPGECVTDQDALVDLMEEYMNRNYKLKQLYEEKAKLFLTYHDHNHSERIYNYLHEHLKD